MSTQTSQQMMDSLNRAYAERNRLAIGMALAVLEAGGKAGFALDPSWQEKGWEIEWATVVYIELPSGLQLSYHMSPEQAAQAQAVLPKYYGEWDGLYTGRSADWPEHYHANT